LDRKSAELIAMDLLIAAADTTANTMLWTVYCLAKYKEEQGKVNEMSSINMDTCNVYV